MYRSRAPHMEVTGVVLFLLSLAGCPHERALDSPTTLWTAADEAATADTSTKEEAVYRALQTPVAEPPATTDVMPQESSLPADTVSALLADAELISPDILSDVPSDPVAWPFVHGLLGGLFWDDPNDPSNPAGGLFHGQWVAADGTPAGTIHGRYQPVPPEELPPGLAAGGVFHGRILDDAGQTLGLLHGRYGHADDRPGLFFGRWYDAGHLLLGVLRGHWQQEPETAGGRFFGRWIGFDLCEEIQTLPEPEFAADDFGGLEASDEVLEDVPWATPALGTPEDPAALGDGPCIDPDQPYGFLRGFYRPAPPEDPSDPPADGIVRLRWRNAAGTATGLVLGHYVRTAPSEETEPGMILGHFYGKYVSLDGTFRGFVRGGYGLSLHGVGVFRGQYLTPEGETLGALAGRWRVAPEWPGGPVRGFWFGLDLDPELSAGR